MSQQHGPEAVSDATLAFAATARDYPALLHTITRRTAEVTHSWCDIGLLSSDLPHWEQVVTHLPDELRARARHELDQLQQSVLQTGRAIWLPDPPPWLEQIGLRSVLCVPLGPEGALVGTLLVASPNQPLQQSDLETVSALAAHASLALGQARELERLRFLSQISRALASSSHDLQLTLDLVTKRCAEVTGDLCTIRLLSEDGSHLGATSSVWHPDSGVRQEVRDLFQHPNPLGEGISGRVAATGRPARLSAATPHDLAVQTVALLRPFIEGMALSSCLVVPLVSAGQILGVLTLGRSGPAYSEDDLQMMNDVADHMGLAMSHHRLVRSLQDELVRRKRAEEQLLQAQKMEAVGRLAGGIAHDFNNLLSVILSYCDILLMDTPETDPRHPDLFEIRTAGHRAAALTSQLLAFSRQRVPEPRVVDLNTVISGMKQMILRLVGEDVAVRIVPQTGPGWVRVDPNHLEQVLMNLVVNARDAMPHGGTLVIETGSVELDESYAIERVGTLAGPHVMLAISDTGVGMDPETRQHLFEPFFTTKGGKGTGLGLSTVYGIIKQNRGSIWVYSEPGAGSTFKIYLPRLAGPSGDLPAPARAPEVAVGGTERVLVVEDDDQVRVLIRGILARHGYQVLDASTPQDALLQQGPFDLLLTDVILPRMGGRELAGVLTRGQPELKVLYMSGYTENAIVLHGVEEGLAVLQKPITPDLLLRKVREVLDGLGVD